jgi:hypothetical protein
MNHTDAQAFLEEYFDGMLPAEVHREIEAHLAGCARCREELSSLGALLDTVAAMRARQVAPSRDLWPEIAAEIGGGARGRSEPGDVPATRSDPARHGERGFATGGRHPFRILIGDRRVPWPWLAGAVGAAAAAVLLVAVLGGKGGYLRPAGGPVDNGGDHIAPAPSAMVAAGGATEVMTRELDMLDAQVESSRQSVRPAEATAGTPSWRLFDQGLAVLDRAIQDSRAALDRDPNNPVLQKTLLAAYQKQLELIRWANRVGRQG